jgi:GT2 family glycosyltransferase
MANPIPNLTQNKKQESETLIGQSAALPAVVIPAYNAARELDSCLRTVHATVPADAEVVIIDDASPDAQVGAVLQAWRDRAGPGWRFLDTPRNRGFVATANRGMQETTGDVVLLNADTEVTPGWLEGLARCLASDRSIATATPWTNNGEIASIPRICAVNPKPPDRDAVALTLAAAMTAGAGPPVYPELPTAVGFCMAVARRTIDRIGLFDEELFGRGYGEENDFSMRARTVGMRNVLCDDVYVVHLGGRSFGPLGLKPDAGSMQRLLLRHPHYLDQVRAFIADDPLAPRRRVILDALDRAGVSLG